MNKSFREMYKEFERKYNKYPVDMARSQAFLCALNDGIIDEQTYEQAKEYYGDLWNYVGD